MVFADVLETKSMYYNTIYYLHVNITYYKLLFLTFINNIFHQ